MQSSNALISDLRPTHISPAALSCLNALLDELLISILTASQSLNPYDLRREGLPSVFCGEKGVPQGESTGVRALGRSAVAEAELELRSWQEGRDVSRGFAPDGQGNGMRGDRPFALTQAVEIMRLKCVSFSTLAPQDPSNEATEDEVLLSWKKAGGDSSEDTLEPAALWLTAIIEHVCEHVLSQLASVVGRDSEISVAGPQELYTALCEDESVWGLFKRMKVKEQLEGAIRAGSKHKRSTPSRPSNGGRSSPALSGSPHASKVSLGQHRDASMDLTRGSPASPLGGNEPRSSTETNRFGGIAGGVIRKGSQLSRKSTNSPKHPLHLRNGHGHERTGSVLSDNTRNMLGAFHDTMEYEEGEQSPQDAQDEFDALVRSGETMKVSLTPSRLKNFDGGAAARKKLQPDSPRSTARSRASSVAQSDQIQPSAFPVPPTDAPLTGTTEFSNRSPVPSRSSPQLRSSPTPGQNTMSTVMGGRPRADSSQRKLQARAATTIEEKPGEHEAEAEADDIVSDGGVGGGSGGGGRRGQKKESLMELFASEGLLGSGSSPTKKPNSDLKRSVPAVVLGTPPPPASPPTVPSPMPIHEVTPPTHDRGHFSPPSAIRSEITSPSSATRSDHASPQSLPQPEFSPPMLTRSQFSSSSLNRPYGRSREPSGDDDEDYSSPGQRRAKKKTEAQELADFFSNNPPPTTSPTFKSPEEEQPPQTAKSTKGFRALVSRVKGSSKKKPVSEEKFDEKTRDRAATASTLPASASHNRLSAAAGPKITGWAGFEDGTTPPQAAGLTSSIINSNNGGSGMPRKQKSLHNLSTVPSAFRPFAASASNSPSEGSSPVSPAQQYAALQLRRNSRTPSETPSTATASAPAPGATTPRSSAFTQGQETEYIKGSGHDDRRGSESKRKMVGLGIATVSPSEARPRTTTAEAASLPSASNRPEPTAKRTSEEDLSAERETVPSLAPPVPEPSLHKQRTELISPLQTAPIDPSPASATSFRTALERHPAGAEAEEAKTATLRADPLIETSTAKSDRPHPSVSTIPVADLIPLRHLLDHATCARECRMLLSAILTQFGVPLSLPSASASKSASAQNASIAAQGMGDDEVENQVKPEDRVMAWLLAGRDGPVGDISRPSSLPPHAAHEQRGRVVDEEYTPTPTPVQSNVLQSTLHPASSKPTTERLDIPFSITEQPPVSESEMTETEYETETETEGEEGAHEHAVRIAERGERGSPVKLIPSANASAGASPNLGSREGVVA
ncbi:hypothetical protein I317_00731 [Kwoniella heveanensis CBS 569]|nr:hypothetical protein I317_00731 [Kwoniella heveanensis CBS 569]